MAKVFFKGGTMLNPVPVVLITSKNKEGKVNVFTVAWAGTACTKPPMVTIAVRPERLSYEYIKETEEFVINLPSRSLVKAVDFCGVRSGRNIDKISEMRLEVEDSEKIAVPSIKQCPVSLECVLKNIIPLGSHDLFIAEIVTVQVDENIIDDQGKIHLEKADLISYSHGEYFPLSAQSIGKFGFSVQKKKKK